MWLRSLVFAAPILFAGFLSSSAASYSVSAASSPVAQFPFCAWWTETTATSLNVAFPDASAAYWTTPFLASADLQSITVAGQFADARYFSLNAYNNGAASYTCSDANTPSALADDLIAPDSGSQNPFQTNAVPGGRFTVTLEHVGVGTPAPNTLPFYQTPGCQPAPAQSVLPSALGFLILRAYLPQGGFSAVALPDLTLHFADGRSMALPQCHGDVPAPAASAVALGWFDSVRQLLLAGTAAAQASGTQPCGRPGAAACPQDLTFFRPSEAVTGGFFPNVDNKYVAALVQPKPDRVVLVRAQAASFPTGMQAQPWDPSVTQLRYWSLCSNVYRRPWPVVVVNDGGQSILGCASDLDTGLDSGGFYTYVLSSLAVRPSDTVLAANTATWLPFSNTQPYARHLLILRNMLGADFAHSVQNCTPGTDPGSIAACAASMATYYPQVAECQAKTFALGGTSACFSEYQLSARTTRAP